MSGFTQEDEARVKGLGFLRNRGTSRFSGRVVPRGGVFSPEELMALAQCAQKFGHGPVAFTSRMTAEIVGIDYQDIEPARQFMAQHNLYFGGTGAKVRPVTCCKGTTCVYGNCDTQALAAKLHDEFYVGMAQVKLPHKFKIGVGGCPNSCVKPSLNDFAVEGRRAPVLELDKCRGCKVCQVEQCCPVHAVQVREGKVVIDPQKCLDCGVCVGKCPFGAVAKESPVRYQVYVGGTWGKTKRMGTPLSRRVEEEEIIPLIHRTIQWFKDNAQPKERLGKAIDRIGMEAFEAALFQ